MQALVAERKFLQEWFNGTPVMIEMDGESALRVEVPLQFAFGPRSAEVTKALQKVVDNVSQSLRRVPTAMYEISAPPDAGSSDLQLATRRAEAVRAAITRRAVLPQRAGAVVGAPSGNVQLRLVIPPAA
jgi:outer membrane protein OmpA-like peptidoglycan-associated protein